MLPTAKNFGLCYYEGLPTPEGKIVVRYRSPDFAPTQFETEHLDWGLLNADCYRLASVLVNDVGSSHWPWPGMCQPLTQRKKLL